MANLLTKARTGRANALKSMTENRLTGETFVMANGRRSARPSMQLDKPVFSSVRSKVMPVRVLSEAAARIKAEQSFLAAAMTAETPNALVH